MKRNRVNIAVSTVLAGAFFLLAGCGTEGGSSSSPINMVIGEEVEVREGDQINALSEDTLVSVRYDDENRSFALLEAGSAELLKAQ